MHLGEPNGILLYLLGRSVQKEEMQKFKNFDQIPEVVKEQNFKKRNH